MTWFVVAVLTALPIVMGLPAVAEREPSDRLLSAIGGIAVAYVFVKLAPQVGSLRQSLEGFPGQLEKLAAEFVVVGVIVGYWVDRREKFNGPGRATAVIEFTVRCVSGMLVGYACTEYDQLRTGSILLFALAIGLHYAAYDHELANRFGSTYRTVGAWVIAGGVLFGATVGQLTSIRGLWALIGIAIVTGTVIYETFRKELPEVDKADFVMFSASALIFSVVLAVATAHH